MRSAMEGFPVESMMRSAMEGFPVERNFDSFWTTTVVPTPGGEMELYEELDDDFLSSLPLHELAEAAVTGDGSSSVTTPASQTGQDKGVHSDCVIKEEPRSDTGAENTAPSEFLFPFEPYDIQKGFMRSLYTALEEKKVGIFESPTGTGKSLSMICGALTWLRDHEEREKRQLEALLSIKTEAADQPVSVKQEAGLDWVQAFTQKRELEENTKKLKGEQALRAKRELRLENLRGNLRHRPKRKRNKLEDEFNELFKEAPSDLKKRLEAELAEDGANNSYGNNLLMDEDLVLDEYMSDEEKSVTEADEKNDSDDEEDHITKIYYCSRTHSQLSQFVREVQKSPFGGDTRVVSLASRQNLCINESVKKQPSVSLLNDRCLELQRNKSERKKRDGSEEPAGKRKKAAAGCPYYKHDPMMNLRDKLLVDVQDIEQLVTAGKTAKACPYYSSRYAIPSAQLVVLPYQMLLHKTTRESLGVRLEGNIVVIDEAHNLVETINNIHSIEVTGGQLTRAHSQLSQYEERFRKRLKAKNLMYIRQILFILASFIKTLGGKAGQAADQQKLAKSGTRLQTINDFLFDSHLDNLNLFKVMRYCQKSKVSRKLHGFVEKYQPQVVPSSERKVEEERRPSWALSRFLTEINQAKETATKPQPEKTQEIDPSTPFTSPLMHIEAFLEALTNADKDGRVALLKQDVLSKSSLRFLLLNPSVHFTDIVQQARCVVVAGGTMQPMSEFKEQLFKAAGTSPEQMEEYSCDHVIPGDHLLPMVLARGSSGLLLDFTYQSREKPEMMDELGRVIYNVCNVTPGGVVCFFPSYEIERTIHDHWNKAKFLDKIAAKKKIFREPKKAGQVDGVLAEYSTCIKRHSRAEAGQMTGAVLFCVVGGKMSEGINFSDDLGRCVVMVGLPYPNIRSPELKEKMDYLNATMPKGPDGKLPGQVHYENLCMKAVNQSIGRAIRHRGDYAAILLLDHRYMRPSVHKQLPTWIARHLQTADRFGPAVASIRKFFTDKKTPPQEEAS